MNRNELAKEFNVWPRDVDDWPCVTRMPAGPSFLCPEANSLMWKAVEEGYGVERASGVAMRDDFVGQLRRIAGTVGPSIRPSMSMTWRQVGD